jgi:hypothetical protein
LAASFILTALLPLSCARVQIVDHEFCADMGTLGAGCFHTMTDDTRDIPKAEWDDMRFGQICTNDPPGRKGETFADWKVVIEKLCSIVRRCDYETKKQLAEFFFRQQVYQRRAEIVQERMNAQ